jgi:hypothetical protein
MTLVGSTLAVCFAFVAAAAFFHSLTPLFDRFVHGVRRGCVDGAGRRKGGVVAIGLHAAVIYSLSGHLQTALTWDLWTGLAVVLVAAALLFLKLFLILKHRH